MKTIKILVVLLVLSGIALPALGSKEKDSNSIAPFGGTTGSGTAFTDGITAKASVYLSSMIGQGTSTAQGDIASASGTITDSRISISADATGPDAIATCQINGVQTGDSSCSQTYP